MSAAPTLDLGDGLHVTGVLPHALEGGQAFRYELAAAHRGINAVPPLALSILVPGAPPRWVVRRTERLAFTRRGGPRPAREVAPSARAEETAAVRGDGWAWLRLLVVLLVGAGAWLLVRTVRSRPPATPAADTAADRRVETAAAIAALRDATPAQVEAALVGVLAARLGVAAPAVHGPRLAERLIEAGVAAVAAADVARLLEALVAARYGGAPIAAPAVAAELLDALAAG